MIRFTRASAMASAAFALLTLPSALLSQRVAPLPINGISCDAMEGQRVHIHQHLLILDHGVSVPVPANVGRPAVGTCLYWVHTHTPDGVIHIESPANRSFTLGDFFAVWGQPLSATRAAVAVSRDGPMHVWVDGKRYTGDPAKIPLASHTDIVIEIGPPYPPPPKFTDWQAR